ncbi:MAG: hypothetical protein ACKOPP_01925, partial [Bacteroidota bacterium]
LKAWMDHCGQESRGRWEGWGTEGADLPRLPGPALMGLGPNPLVSGQSIYRDAGSPWVEGTELQWYPLTPGRMSSPVFTVRLGLGNHPTPLLEPGFYRVAVLQDGQTISWLRWVVVRP